MADWPCWHVSGVNDTYVLAPESWPAAHVRKALAIREHTESTAPLVRPAQR